MRSSSFRKRPTPAYYLASGRFNFGPTGTKREVRLKPCPYVGCNELIPPTKRGCDAHRNILTERDAERRRNHPRNLIYRDPRWRLTRQIVFERDGYTCVYCGHYDLFNAGRTLSCDHANAGGVMACPDPFDPVYCTTACRVCSGRKDGRRGANG